MSHVVGGPEHGVVAAGHPAVVEAGRRVLARGGNAVDAVVAAMFTSFHAEPILGGPGGGGFLVARVDGEPVAYDFFANAPGLGAGSGPYQPPAGAFLRVSCDFGSTTQDFHVGAGSVAVPGVVPGLCAAQAEAGRLSLREVLEPALEAAQRGTEVSHLGFVVSSLLRSIVSSRPEYERLFLRPDGTLLQEGDTFHNRELVHLVEALAAEGPRVLVDGAPARALVAEVRAHGGGLTSEDLAAYRVVRLRPLVAPMGDAALLLVPPPSSGGMLIAYGAALFERLPPANVGSVGDLLLRRAVLAESLRARAEIIGDATPAPEHAARLLDPAALELGAARVRALLERGPGALPDHRTPALGSTTHVSAIDRHGNAAAVTTSIGEASGLVVPGYGLFPNNFLGEEDLNPLGFHRFPPGVRMGSSMSPTLVVGRHGEVVALGTGGANRIRTALLQVIRHLVVHRWEPARAVAADRVHYEDGTLFAEAVGVLREAVHGVEAAGTRVARFDAPSMFFGGVHVVGRHHDGTVYGVGDARRSGVARLA